METEHVALYRKYRPTVFKDVSGQEQVTSVLEAAIEKGSIGHAYLFAGSRGIGKTTIARIFARAIGTTAKDTYEMDAASNRRIEDFRELNDSVATMPFDSKYKVYIIDEVHMLTKEAFNAFLKTLEEPPAHVIFILATTEPDKLPDTIISRCEVHRFKTPTRALIAEVVKKAAKKEGNTLEKSAAELIALLADGSFRDALGILQKVLTISKDTTVNIDEVEAVTGAARSELVQAVLRGVARGDAAPALAAIRTAVEANTDMHTFYVLLIQRVRAVLLLRFAPELKKELATEFSDEEFVVLFELASDKTNNINSHILERFLAAYVDAHHSYLLHIPLEIAVMEMSTKNK